MDKAQKSLIKTYYRKRNIAAEQVSSYDLNNQRFNNYEVYNDFIKHNLNILNINALNDNQLVYYFNLKFDKDIYDYISTFKFANNTIAFAETKDGKYFFINKEGKPSIEGINKNDFNRMKTYERTQYFNQKINKNLYEYVSYFKFANNTLAFVKTNDGKYFFINMEGKPSIEGINKADILSMNNEERKIYNNLKNG